MNKNYIMKNLLIFANQIGFGMETITLGYEPESEFAAALEELIRNSNGVRVLKRKKTESKRKKSNGRLIDEIIKTAPKDVPLTDEEIQEEVNAVRYCL